MRVIIAGGGIGGLALAQGLRRAGIDVTVLERNLDLTATGGYRLHLAAPALRALRRLLPPTLLERLHAVSAADRRGISVRDHRGRLLVRASPPPGPGGIPAPALDIDRIALRLLLADGLDDALQLGSTVSGFSEHTSGVSVAVGHNALDARHAHPRQSTSTLECDVLVAADGARSRLSEQLAGGPTARPTGFTGVAGWTSGEALGTAARQLLTASSVLAVGPGGTGLYASWHDPVRDSPLRRPHRGDSTTAECAATCAEDEAARPARAIWGLIAVEKAIPAGGHASLAERPGSQALAVAAAMLQRRGWSDTQRSIVERADPATVGVFSFWAADPERIAPWPSGHTTALGDAVHAVPPTGGRGAATAIEDAADLQEALVRACDGQVSPVVAVHDYERLLRVRGADAVRESLQPLAWIRATATPLGSAASRVALPVAVAASAVARRARRR